MVTYQYENQFHLFLKEYNSYTDTTSEHTLL